MRHGYQLRRRATIAAESRLEIDFDEISTTTDRWRLGFESMVAMGWSSGESGAVACDLEP